MSALYVFGSNCSLPGSELVGLLRKGEGAPSDEVEPPPPLRYGGEGGKLYALPAGQKGTLGRQPVAALLHWASPGIVAVAV